MNYQAIRLLLTAFVLAGCREQPQQTASSTQPVATTVELTPEEKEFLGNQAAFNKAKSSVMAPTFEGAQLLLEQVKNEDITDAELASYVALCKKIAALSADLGIPRDSGLGYTDIITNLDYAAVLKHLTSKGIANAPSEGLRLVSESQKIKNQLPTWEKLQRILSKRYSK